MQRLKTYKNELSVEEKKIEDLNKKILELEDTKRREVAKLRKEYDAKVEIAMSRLRKLENSRDAEIRFNQQEITSQREMTSSIVDQLDKMLDMRKKALDQIERMGIPRIRRNYTLVYLPFYLVCYQKGAKKRYVLYPASIASNMNSLTMIKGLFGFFGFKKIKSLLKERSKPITNLLKQIIPLISNNPAFEREIIETGKQSNILRRKELFKDIGIGLMQLKDEEWISEREMRNISKILTSISPNNSRSDLR
jgi:hypothetical protein